MTFLAQTTTEPTDTEPTTTEPTTTEPTPTEPTTTTPTATEPTATEPTATTTTTTEPTATEPTTTDPVASPGDPAQAVIDLPTSLPGEVSAFVAQIAPAAFAVLIAMVVLAMAVQLVKRSL
jgi:flagellum-specific peptidoglycan hydrolase FlgJ